MKPVGNLRPAPFALNEASIPGLIEGRTAPGIAMIPLQPLRLVDRPRRSEDPRLARANDNSLLPPPGKVRSGEDGARGAASGSLPVLNTAPQSPSNDGAAL